MREINFYIIDSDLESFFYSFLTKTLEKDKKSIVYSENNERLEKLDDYLWSCKKIEFLPHSLDTDREAEKTPVVLTCEKKNINNANFLFLENYLDDVFLDSFEKTLYIVPQSNQKAFEEAKSSYEKYFKNGDKIRVFKKDKVGKWAESESL